MEYELFKFVALVTMSLTMAENTTVSSKTLYILSLLPFPDPFVTPSIEDGPAILPAVQIAVEHINQRSDVLPGFTLDFVVEDSGCDIVDKTYLSFVRNTVGRVGSSVVGVVGPRCITSARAVADLVRHREISLISVHLSGSEQFNNNQYSFGMLGSTMQVVTETQRFLEAVGWDRIAVWYASSPVYQKLYDSFVASLLRNSSISINVSALASPDEFSFSLIKQMKTRIIVLFLDANLAKKVACFALQEKVTYPNYQMIWVALSVTDFNRSIEFKYKGDTYYCSANDIISTALNGGVFLNYRLTPIDLHHPSISGYSYNQFYDQYNVRLKTTSEFLHASQFASVMYDAVWTLGLALNATLDKLSNYHYGMPLITNIVAERLLAASFRGISGLINFDRSRRLVNRVIDILLLLQGETSSIIIPNISTQHFIEDTFDNRYTDIMPIAIYTILVVVLLQLLLIIATHIVVCLYRNDRSIRALSIKLNHFVFIGTYLFIAGTLFYLMIKRETLVESVASIICHVTWSWVLSIGFTLVVGTVTVRVWRVYRIFVHYRKPGPFISNKVLVSMVLLQILVDLAIAITWTLLDPIRATIISEEASESDGTTFIEIERSCLSRNTLLWASILIGWKVLQLLSMLTLAIITRKVKNKDFSTQNVQVASYILAITTVLGSMLFLSLFLNRTNIHWDFGVLSFVFIVIISVCYCSILLPPVLRLMSRKYRGNKDDPSAHVKRMTSLMMPQVRKVSTTF